MKTRGFTFAKGFNCLHERLKCVAPSSEKGLKRKGGGIIKNSIETREQVKQKHLRIEWLRDKLDALPAVSR